MPRKKHSIAGQKPRRVTCEHNTWTLRSRNGIFYADGRPFAKKYSLGTTDLDEALANLKRLDHQIAVEKQETTKAPRLDQMMPIGIQEGWEHYISHASRPRALGGTRKSSQDNYRSVAKNHRIFCDYAGIKTWNEIDEHTALEFGKWLASDKCPAGRPLAGSTIRRNVAWISAVNKYLIERKLLPVDLRFSVSLPKQPGSRRYCPTKAEVGSILKDANENETVPSWVADGIALLAFTGMRIGEVGDLEVSSVDLVRGHINIVDTQGLDDIDGDAHSTTKSSESRSVPIMSDLRPTLDRLVVDARSKNTAKLWTDDAGHPVRHSVFREKLYEIIATKFGRSSRGQGKGKKSASGKQTIHDLVPHCFRHFFVSIMASSGVGLLTLQQWVGHRDSKIVWTYYHYYSPDAKKYVDEISMLE